MEKRALISVSNKDGIVDFARFLSQKGYKILSTGSTARILMDSGVETQPVEEYTHFKEILSGRVKTLHPRIHAGILFKRDDSEHLRTIEELDIDPIDVVVVNLYPFERVAKTSNDMEELIENIDIGGPTLLRAAAKNYKHVLVVCDPADYNYVMESFDTIGEEERFRLAMKAFSHTAYYDSLIVERFEHAFQNSCAVPMKKAFDLRYGENPHQKASLFKDPLIKGIPDAEQLHGKELSYNNLLDIDIAYRIMLEFDEPACAIIKHTTPCGVACAESHTEAFKRALETDPVSAFGGIIGINGTVSDELASLISARFFEVVVAYDFQKSALETLKVRKNLRLVKIKAQDYANLKEVRSIIGGYLVQDADLKKPFNYKVVSEKKPSQDELIDLEFAFRVAKFVKSNAIVFAKNRATLAIGGGETSRIDAARFASLRAKELNIDLKGSVMASDGFFPFRDSVDLAAKLGVTAIVEPGGSIRDSEVIQASNEHSIALLFTGIRHFRH